MYRMGRTDPRPAGEASRGPALRPRRTGSGLRCTVEAMELHDPNLPDSANDWLLATSDQVQALGIQWHAAPESASMADIVDTLLALAEAQARIIATMDLRIQALESRTSP